MSMKDSNLSNHPINLSEYLNPHHDTNDSMLNKTKNSTYDNSIEDSKSHGQFGNVGIINNPNLRSRN